MDNAAKFSERNSRRSGRVIKAAWYVQCGLSVALFLASFSNVFLPDSITRRVDDVAASVAERLTKNTLVNGVCRVVIGASYCS
jgi:hypothetical protein